MERRTTERVAVFVDGANLYHSIKNYYKGILDYARLLSAAVGDRKLLRATFYIVEKQEADEGQGTTSARSFVYNLNKFGYKVRSKPLMVHETLTPDGERTVSHKGDWDIGVVVDMMRLAGSRRHLRPRLRRRRLRRGRRVPPERKRHPRRGDKRGPVHFPGPTRRLRRPHGPGRHTGAVQATRAAQSRQRSAVS